MCGIAGLVYQDPRRLGAIEEVAAMVAALRHRGPDDEGAIACGPAVLGHRRLSVIDLSRAARQPIANEDETVWLSFNGEIYNFQELRRALIARGHRFRSDGDAEVIVHLYEDEGIACVEKLRGMFAFALWDSKRGRLVLARDRLGQKPLHYRDDADALRFASEPFALHAGYSGPLSPDPLALRSYLALGYVPAPRSAFSDAAKLPPACVLVKEPGRAPEIHRYWSLSYGPKLPANTARQRAAIDERIREGIFEAVRLRRISDVPLGAFLSGGLDSSAVTAALARAGGPPETFSIGFGDRRYDERRYAREVARRYRCQHHEEVVAPDAAAVAELLAVRFGEPFADSSALPCYYLARMARRSVTVALSGDGGDEVFGGYNRHLAEGLAARLSEGPPCLAALLRAAASALPDRAGRDDPGHRLRRFVAGLSLPPELRAASWARIAQEGELAALLTRGFAARSTGEVLESALAAYRAASDGEVGDRMLQADLGVYLPDDLLVKVDITSMAHGLEVRAPLLDHKLVELAARLPSCEKAWGLTTKRALKRALRPDLSPRIRRRSKKGFAVPLGEWLRGPLRGFVDELLFSKRARGRGYFAHDPLRRLVSEHAAGARREHVIWALCCLELWLRASEQRFPGFRGALA